MVPKVPWHRARFQTASTSLRAGKSFRGKHYDWWGATDSPKKTAKRAKKKYKYVRVLKMPKTIRKTDPESAKYNVFVRSKKVA